MNFQEINLDGACIINIEKNPDDRGFFARSWCQKEFEENGIITNFVQSNISLSKFKGTLRGMHYQIAPWQETKLIRCTRGSIYDVIIDLKPDSKTYGRWFGTELSADNYKMLYVPQYFAHGFITLQDNTEVTYQVSEFYQPTAERGIRYNDPLFSIKWPIDVTVISEKDKNWPDYTPD